MEGLCKDHWTDQLVALLREADPDHQFNYVVTRAKNQLTAEQKQAKRTDLEKLFDSQIATLKDRGTPEQIVEILQNKKDAVLKKASEMIVGDGNIPFLPVIPLSFRSHYDLMAMVRNGRKVGHTLLNPIAISDVVKTPKEPYYIYDIEDGSSTRDKLPENTEKILKSQNRSPLTVAEVIALTTHTNVLSKHSVVWAAGSIYKSACGVPDVYLTNDDRPWLGWGDYFSSLNNYPGLASCGSR